VRIDALHIRFAGKSYGGADFDCSDGYHCGRPSG
jgi:hypothetical protein